MYVGAVGGGRGGYFEQEEKLYTRNAVLLKLRVACKQRVRVRGGRCGDALINTGRNSSFNLIHAGSARLREMLTDGEKCPRLCRCLFNGQKHVDVTIGLRLSNLDSISA